MPPKKKKKEGEEEDHSTANLIKTYRKKCEHHGTTVLKDFKIKVDEVNDN